jgi:hypothetical protein
MKFSEVWVGGLLCALLSCLYAGPVQAFSAGERSLGIGVNRNGFLLEATLYSQTSWQHGFYFGLGGWALDEQGLPLDGYFPWVEYGNRDWSAAYSLHGGYAVRPSRAVSMGIGVGLSFRDYYLHGTSPVTGLEWKVDAPDENNVGPHAWIELGQSRGKAVRVQYGPARVGVSMHWRY